MLHSERGYVSRFTSWDEQAWVRAKPHRVAPFEREKKFFSADHCPLLVPREVAEAPEAVRDMILVHALYAHLSFTVALEIGPVNEVCALLNHGDVVPWLSPRMRLDALRIYADEGGHAEMTYALLGDVCVYTGIDCIRHTPAFLKILDAIINEACEVPSWLVKIAFAVVSETLITTTLKCLPADETVQPAIRAVLADHAADEGKHHAYFRQLFGFLWPRLNVVHRTGLGMLFPRMIDSFLRPDEELNVKILVSVGYPPWEASQISRSVIERWSDSGQACEDAARTLQMFRQAGVLDNDATAAEFARHGLRLEFRK